MERLDGVLDFDRNKKEIDPDVLLYAKLNILKQRAEIQNQMKALVINGESYKLSGLQAELKKYDMYLDDLNSMLEGDYNFIDISVPEIEQYAIAEYKERNDDMFVSYKSYKKVEDSEVLEDEISKLEDDYNENDYLIEASREIEEEERQRRMREQELELNNEESYGPSLY